MAKVTEEDVEKAPDVESQEKDGRFSRRVFSFRVGCGRCGGDGAAADCRDSGAGKTGRVKRRSQGQFRWCCA